MSDVATSQRLEPSHERGRDELNLIDFPIAVLQHQQPKDKNGGRPDELVSEIEAFDKDLKKVVPRTLTRRTASKHGFPTPLEDEVLVALLTLTRIKNGFSQPRVKFRNGELFDLMKWPHNGSSNQRLAIALDRLTGLTLKYENSWSTEAGTFEKEFTTGLLESYQLTKQVRGRGERSREASWFQWASEVFADIQRGNVRTLNTDQFFSLQRPISRRMYRFLDKHLSEEPKFEMDLIMFASHLGLAETQHIGKIKERLATGVRELEQIPGFIDPLPPSERYQKLGPGNWQIQFQRSGAQQTTTESRIPTSSPKRAPNAAENMIKDFYQSWNGNQQHQPTVKERQQAEHVIQQYGLEMVQQILPGVIKAMRVQFPEARAFGATMVYWNDVAQQWNQRQQREQQEKAQNIQEQQEERQRQQEKQHQDKYRTQWNQLPEADRDEIRQAVMQTCSRTVRQFIEQGKYDDPLVMMACLAELAKRDS
ncbi:Replication initiator protein A [Gimesia alba]|uniref:Replication initiator protein A n=2 Tax=Gimesia alba TaxID=2527973 RepID=A0A517R961_9PLAN|nr:Replication initiator protein A [Gimesia alba]